MKLFSRISTAAMLLIAAIPAFAQIDYFNEPKTIFAGPILISATTSNQTIDIHGFVGIAKVDVIGITNSGNGTLTFQILTSADRTNFTALNNFAYATNIALYTTNNYYGTATPLATNNYNLGAMTNTPTASSAGFATPYLNYTNTFSQFTNAAAITMGNTNSIVTIGFDTGVCQRYIQYVWTVSGGSSPTNTVCAIFTGRKQQFP